MGRGHARPVRQQVRRREGPAAPSSSRSATACCHRALVEAVRRPGRAIASSVRARSGCTKRVPTFGGRSPGRNSAAPLNRPDSEKRSDRWTPEDLVDGEPVARQADGGRHHGSPAAACRAPGAAPAGRPPIPGTPDARWPIRLASVGLPPMPMKHVARSGRWRRLPIVEREGTAVGQPHHGYRRRRCSRPRVRHRQPQSPPPPAASTALPPAFRISTPACVASDTVGGNHPVGRRRRGGAGR